MSCEAVRSAPCLGATCNPEPEHIHNNSEITSFMVHGGFPGAFRAIAIYAVMRLHRGLDRGILHKTSRRVRPLF